MTSPTPAAPARPVLPTELPEAVASIRRGGVYSAEIDQRQEIDRPYRGASKRARRAMEVLLERERARETERDRERETERG